MFQNPPEHRNPQSTLDIPAPIMVSFTTRGGAVGTCIIIQTLSHNSWRTPKLHCTKTYLLLFKATQVFLQPQALQKCRQVYRGDRTINKYIMKNTNYLHSYINTQFKGQLCIAFMACSCEPNM